MGSKSFRPALADKIARAPQQDGPSREQILAERLRSMSEASPAIDTAEGARLERIDGVLVFTDPVPPGDMDDWIEAVREERLREILG